MKDLSPPYVGSQKLEWLEALRGLAALWVLFHHAHVSASHFAGWDIRAAGPIIANGYLGVDFFFVLSGFIIAFSSQRLTDRGGGFWDYAQARMLRIYLPYLPVGVGIYLLYLVLPGLSEGGRSPGLVTSLTLLPSQAPPALAVAWTLVHEMLFYAVFSLWFVSRRALWVVLVAWTSMIATAWVIDAELSRLERYLMSPLNLCFLMGVAVYKISRQLEQPSWARRGGGATAIAAVGLVMVLLQAFRPESTRLWVAIGFALIVLAASSPGAGKARLWRPLILLGAASYSVYLIHGPVLSVAARLAARVGLVGWLAFLFISVVALGAGILYWAIYEQRALDMARQWLTGRKARPEVQRCA